MRYILDSSTALKWVLAEPDSSKALQLRDEFSRAVHYLLAPDIFQFEIGHALTRAERQKRILVGQASLFWADIMSTSPHLEPSGTLVPRALVLSSTFRIGLYDCLYLAVAEREQCKVLTGDQRLVNTFPALTVHLSLL
ncbi:MAG TPA: type II toxin-antitoxin system VapC family toxin [Pirellulales bacterium]|nr:type II toxin-antitoxin system VapC family toxin [Pirellulales bacterium]